MQQQLFRCKNCGCDTLSEQHKPQCAMAQQEATRQTIEKCRELGINFNPERYQLPLRLGGT